LDKAWSLLCVSLSAQLATFPLSIYYFSQFPNLFLVTNLIVIPLATLILYLGVAWVVFLWLPVINDILGWVTVKVTYFLNYLITLVNSFPYAKMEGIYINVVAVLLFYALIIFATSFFMKPKRWSLRFTLSIITILCVMHLHHQYYSKWQDKHLAILYEDNPVFVRLLHGKAELYPSHNLEESKDMFERRLSGFFLKHGISVEELNYHYPGEDLSNESAVLHTSRDTLQFDYTNKRATISFKDKVAQVNFNEKLLYLLGD
jgi:hypothetical protein